MMLRREFLYGAMATLAATSARPSRGEQIAQSAQKQLSITTGYDPAYRRIPYPNGDIPRQTGICADVIIRACRDALSLDLQQHVHEDMQGHFADYPSHQHWGLTQPDSNIDHRRVLNLECFWSRHQACLWKPTSLTPGNAFPVALQPGDFLTWRLNGHLPHIAVVSDVGFLRTTLVHNWGNGAEETWLHSLKPHTASGHFRWPTA